MFKYNKKMSSFMFGISFLLGIILFTMFGATFAYFQIKTDVQQNYVMGSVGAYWYNGSRVTDGASYNLNTSNTPLVRGDNAGIGILDASGNAGGMLQIEPDDNAQDQYIRISYKTYIDGVEVNLGENLVLRIATTSGSTTTYVELGDTSSAWQQGTDGWYYYTYGSGIVSGVANPISICNNVMLKELDEQYLEKSLEIKFTFETLQVANNPVESVWGTAAKTVLGID